MKNALLFAIGAAVIASAPAVAQDANRAPQYGSITLNAGFMPDPMTASLQAGGEINARQTLSAQPGCLGNVSAAPGYNLYYTAGGGFDLYISATSDRDTTLVVRGPDGRWACNDDAFGLNPGVMFESPRSGLYSIWVGTYSPGAPAPAMLHISEIGFGPNPGPQGGGLDWSLEPAYGEVTLHTGFTPDPHNLEMMAGGEVNVWDALPDTPGCRGWAASAPDYRLHYTAGNTFDLYISATSGADTTLIVNGPDGRWHCNDDAYGLNPGLMFENPRGGQYDIWVGTYSEGPLRPAVLHISELGFGADASIQPGADGGWFDDEPGPAPAGELDWSLEPPYGEVTLRAGFMPDPHSIDMLAGGGVNVRAQLGGNCVGWAAEEPDYRLHYTAGSFDLYISAASEADTALIVNGPDGRWHCDDDGAEGLNPGIRFSSPESGQYDIWVATYSEGPFRPARLHISEIGFQGATPASGGGLDYSLPANYGAGSLRAGFTPDPFRLELLAGGDINAREALSGEPGCIGWVTASPDYELTYQAGDVFDLYISAGSSADTTLIVNAPDGSWRCNDDAWGLNPGIVFDNPQSGVYDIWVGTYSRTEPREATLFISELGFGEER